MGSMRCRQCGERILWGVVRVTRHVADAQSFYELRDRRSCEYLGEPLAADTEIAIGASNNACQTEAGQLLLCTLINLLSRVHRRVTVKLSAPAAQMRINSLADAADLGTEMLTIATRADPFGRFSIEQSAQSCSCVSVECSGTGRRWHLGVNRSIASLSVEPVNSGSGSPGDQRGAVLAAILGAAAMFKEAHGIHTVPITLSAWNWRSGDDAAAGPASLEPIRPGRALLVGAGAVACGLVYCAWHWGAEADWTVVDADLVALHNTNRGLLFFPGDAGWPCGPPVAKARRIEPFLPTCDVDIRWYDESDRPAQQYDTVLALANERDVRSLIAARNDPIQLHATTGRSWLSQLHRHVAGSDDCIRCRMNDISDVTMLCSDAAIPSAQEEPSNDAALPFLSAASGLMLAIALQRLSDREFWTERHNTWRWDFLSAHRAVTAGRSRCRPGCTTVLPRDIRRMIAGSTQWAHIVDSLGTH